MADLAIPPGFTLAPPPGAPPATAAATAAPAAAPQTPTGQIEPGNIDLSQHPIVRNADGTISTRSIAIEEDGKQVLIPTGAADGSRTLSTDEAVKQYHDTGQHFGKFDTAENANAAAEQLHESQAQQYTQQPGPPPLPSLEDLLGRIPETTADGRPLSPQAQQIAQQAVVKLYHEQQQATEETRARLENSLKNGMAMLADGRDFAWNEAAIRSVLPPEKADPLIQGLEDATIDGNAKARVAGMTPDQIVTEAARLKTALDTGSPMDYRQRVKEASAFGNAVKARNEQLVGEKADPANYVALNNPRIARLQATANAPGANPQAFADYAIASLAEQNRLGVPAVQQHVLTNTQAQQFATAISSHPEQAADTLAGLATKTGQAWPQVWSDLVTRGKLPAGYQVVGQLADYDPANALILSRAEGARNKDDQAFEKLVGAKAPGGKSIKDIADETIPVDERVQSYERSLEDSGASPAQVVAIRGAIEHLAAGRAIFLHEDPSEATTKAIDAVVGHYEFMPNGGGRVPADRYSDVSANAQTTLDRLSPGNVRVPEVFGKGTGAPTPQDYVDQLKAQATWITGPKADRLLLMDHAGRLVKDNNGQNIEVPFASPRVVPPPTATLIPAPVYAPPF